MNALHFLAAYAQGRYRHFPDRAALLAHQQRQLARFRHRVLPKSPYFRAFCQQPFADWPLMNKALMMQHFDTMNTAGLRLGEALALAQQAEASRDFRATLRGYSVGLSSGTSGQRGVFVLSGKERAQWAGVILGQMLPHGLCQRERIAFFLRADNPLYQGVRGARIDFRFFDLFRPFATLVAEVKRYRPGIIVAPAQVLCALAPHGELAGARVVSVAEVLDGASRAWLAERFAAVDEIYQATEGLLATTCALGRLHLNEDWLLIEEEALDAQRFVPVITDFTRETQPIVRYRLDDVLVRGEPCPCGSPRQTIARIEGRCHDSLVLPARGGGTVTLFADLCERALAQVLPPDADYQLEQHGACDIHLTLAGDDARLAACQRHLQAVFATQGVDNEALCWTLGHAPPARDVTTKRRRIRRL